MYLEGYVCYRIGSGWDWGSYPLSGVTVTAKDSAGVVAGTATTDTTGLYSISVGFGMYTLVFTKAGYTTTSIYMSSSSVQGYYGMPTVLQKASSFLITAKASRKYAIAGPTDSDWHLGEVFTDGNFSYGYSGIGQLIIKNLASSLGGLSQVKLYGSTTYANWADAASMLHFWGSDDIANPAAWKYYGSNTGFASSVYDASTTLFTITKSTSRYRWNHAYWKLCPLYSNNYRCTAGNQCNFLGPLTEVEVTFT